MTIEEMWAADAMAYGPEAVRGLMDGMKGQNRAYELWPHPTRGKAKRVRYAKGQEIAALLMERQREQDESAYALMRPA